MIYTKKANFPYPILMNESEEYLNSEFMIEVSEFMVKDSEYKIKFKYNLSSKFILRLINEGKASIILIIKERNNQFFEIENIKEEVNELEISIPKNKLYLTGRTVFQMIIKTNTDINFKNNNDLNFFYNDYKSEIRLKRGMSLGFSNILSYTGNTKEAVELFEKRVQSDQVPDFQVELTNSSIVLSFKNEEMQLKEYSYQKNLMNPYIYIGLYKALCSILINQNSDRVEVKDIDYAQSGLLEKLYKLLINKNIEYITLDEIDKIIHKISEGILEKFTNEVRRIKDEN